MMYKHMVVALDGSSIAEAVLPHVTAIATEFGSAITLVQATVASGALATPTTARTVAGEAASAQTSLLKVKRGEALAYLGAIAQELAARRLEVQVAHAEGKAAYRAVTFKHADAVKPLRPGEKL